jgi:hypothetical protein
MYFEFCSTESINGREEGLPDIIFFKPKIPIWVNFGGSCNGRSGYVIWPLVYFTVIWYILWPFDIFYEY